MNTHVLPPFDIYHGDGEPHGDRAAKLPTEPVLFQEAGRYLADPELRDAVNIALATGQPLLLTGEPGCGKTRLAWSVAHELALGEPLTFYTRSQSQARDLLYGYDAVRRFYDIQIQDPRSKDAANYVEYGPLGQAIRSSSRRLVLIDEIDKAPRDFPNDLLNELDRMVFQVPELPEEQRTLRANIRPVVIITSNTERQLPLPFLRRCVFCHIPFPTREKLTRIIHERLGPMNLDGALVEAAIDRFQQVRRIDRLTKKPATGELLAWLVALNIQGMLPATLFDCRMTDLPLLPALLKDRDDFAYLAEARC
ncbi:MAG: MoxR family ATPase [Magnetococcales bacterium]|nr:MoxR family ATPase [Magnetococcales bacterium]